MFIFLLVCLGANLTLKGQESNKLLEGKVSFITGESIYVKFESTQGIENSDTLFLIKDGVFIPALVVLHHSSISCLCNDIGDNSFKAEDKVYSKIKKSAVAIFPLIPETQIEQDVQEQVLTSNKLETQKKTNEQDVRGRISVASYSSFSNTIADDIYRFRYTLSMDAQNIGNSKLSAETYISFSHKLNQWDLVKENLNNALKVYSLALQYDFNESTTLYAGRKINPKIANIGAVDGLQFEKRWKNYFAGVVAGSRPDYQNYGFNPDLFEYGVYIGQDKRVENGFIQSSLAFVEQRNNSNIDRRFMYFQHSNSFIKNINIFSSFEVDLYKLENGIPTNSISLTSLYFSLRYKVSQRLSLFGSYDNRKNVIYYETFKNYTDAILQQASRQGLRFRVNYRPLNYLNLGINAGRRFMKSDPRATNTINGFATYSRIPTINASVSLSANLMQTSYLDGQVYGVRLNKDLVPGKFYGMVNYRWVQFKYANASSQLNQNIGELNLSYQFNKRLYLSVNIETTFQEKQNFNRLYLNLRWKF